MIISYHSSAHINPFYDWTPASSNQLPRIASFIFIRAAFYLDSNLRLGRDFSPILLVYIISYWKEKLLGGVSGWTNFCDGLADVNFVYRFEVGEDYNRELELRIHLGISLSFVHFFYFRSTCSEK